MSSYLTKEKHSALFSFFNSIEPEGKTHVVCHTSRNLAKVGMHESAPMQTLLSGLSVSQMRLICIKYSLFVNVIMKFSVSAITYIHSVPWAASFWHHVTLHKNHPD